MWSLVLLPNFWNIIGLTALLSLFYVVTIAIYRLTLHPLAKYPGPFISKVSSWSIFYQATTGDRHLEQLREHERYGPIVRIGPNALSINTISALKEIYANRRGNVQKARFYDILDASTGDYSTHSEIDRTKHAARRRVLDHAFSDSALRSAETFVTENVETFCNLMRAECPSALKTDNVERARTASPWSAAKNMSTWSTYLNYDIMGDLVFGKRFNCMTSEDHRFVPNLMMNGTGFIYSISLSPVPFLRPILASGILAYVGGQMARDERAYVDYAVKEMTERVAIEKKLHPVTTTTTTTTNEEKLPSSPSQRQPRKDIAHYLINATDPLTNTGFTRTQLDADSSLLIAAGADTTSVTFSAAFFYLLHNPSTLATLTSEIRSSFPDRHSIRALPGSTLTKLPYLRAVIDETLRLAPPVTAMLPREVLPGGLTIPIPITHPDGTISEEPHVIPAHTVVGTSAYAIHHSPSYYPDPFSFNPSRWIPDDSPNPDPLRTTRAVSTARAAFCAFSLGTRGCVGRALAYMELSLSLARTLWLFDIRLAEEVESEPNVSRAAKSKHPLRWRKDEFQLVDQFLSGRDGPMVQFRARDLE